MSELSTTDDTFDRIEKYYRQSGKLSVKETEICGRWELAFAIYSAQKNKKVAVAKYIAVLKGKGIELSPAQAYRDFTAAEKLFTPLQKYTKDFLKMVIIESALKDVRKAERLADKTTDPKAWAQIMDIKNKAEKRIIEASGLALNDPDIPDFAKLQANVFNINMDKQTINMLQKLMQRGSVDITEVYKQMQEGAEDAEIIG